MHFELNILQNPRFFPQFYWTTQPQYVVVMPFHREWCILRKFVYSGIMPLFALTLRLVSRDIVGHATCVYNKLGQPQLIMMYVDHYFTKSRNRLKLLVGWGRKIDAAEPVRI